MANGQKKIFVTSLTEVTNDDREGLGVIRHEGNKVYKYVQYDTGAGAVAAVANQVAFYYLVNGYSGSKVTSDLTDSVNIGAGVLLAAPGDGQYCWVQIQGPATLALALVSGDDGDALTAVGGADGNLAISALVTDHVCAVADDASLKTVVCMFPY